MHIQPKWAMHKTTKIGFYITSLIEVRALKPLSYEVIESVTESNSAH
jgi:hypothetical protein